MPPRLFIWSVFALTAASCTQFKPGSIQTAHIETPILFPKRMVTQTRGEVWSTAASGVVGGIVGGAISGAMSSSTRSKRWIDQETLRVRFEQDLLRILKEELEARGQFRIVEEPADATIQVRVALYGYMAGVLSGKQGPALSLYLWMLDQRGKRIWNTYTDRPDAPRVEKAPPILREASVYENDPEVLLQDLNTFARWQIRRLALEIPVGTRPPPRGKSRSD